MSASRYCSKCRGTVTAETTYCPQCGVKLVHPEPTSRKRVGEWPSNRVMVGGLSVAALVLLVGLLDRKPQPETSHAPPSHTTAPVGSSDLALRPAASTAQDSQTAVPLKPVEAPSRWLYSDGEDQMTRKKILHASVGSTNQVSFRFPYAGSQYGTLHLRKHPRHGRDVALTIERGQFLCDIESCTVMVRFDNGKPQAFSASRPDNYSSTALFLQNYDRFIGSLRRARKIYIEARFYQEAAETFEFDVHGLEWDTPPLKNKASAKKTH